MNKSSFNSCKSSVEDKNLTKTFISDEFFTKNLKLI